MNKYKICFRCEGVLQFAELTSDQIANFVMSEGHEIQSLIDKMFDDDTQYFEHHFKQKGKYYIATFSYNGIIRLNIFCRPGGKEDIDNEYLIAENADYIPVSCEDEDGNVIWTLNEEF